MTGVAASDRPKRLPHQTTALQRILHSSGLLLGLGTGMGKSRIMLEAGQYLTTKLSTKPVLLVVPNSIIEEMVDQIQTWLGAWGILVTFWFRPHTPREKKVLFLRHYRKHLKKGGMDPRMLIVSHEDLSYLRIVEELQKISWAGIFVDEASRFRNNSRRSRALERLHAHADHRVAASGSFVTNSPMDIWYALRFVAPNQLARFSGRGGRELFMRHFCEMGGFGGTKPIGIREGRGDELQALLDPVRIQLTLNDVREMPARMLQVRRVDLTPEQEQAYAQMADTMLFEYEGMDDETFSANVESYVARMQKLQEIGAGFIRDPETKEVHYFETSAKHYELLELLRDPTPTIVYTWWVPEFTETRRRLYAEGIEHATLGDRLRFIEGGVDVLVLPMGKGAYGLNLDRARRMIYVSLPWDLDVYGQSQERNWRLTTTESKLIVHLLARDTIDEHVRRRLIAKSGMALTMTRSQALEMLRRGENTELRP